MQWILLRFILSSSVMQNSVLYSLFPGTHTKTNIECAWRIINLVKDTLVCPKLAGLPEQGVDSDRVLQTGTYLCSKPNPVAHSRMLSQPEGGIRTTLIVAHVASHPILVIDSCSPNPDKSHAIVRDQYRPPTVIDGHPPRVMGHARDTSPKTLRAGDWPILLP
eukprot:g30150.t1